MPFFRVDILICQINVKERTNSLTKTKGSMNVSEDTKKIPISNYPFSFGHWIVCPSSMYRLSF